MLAVECHRVDAGPYAALVAAAAIDEIWHEGGWTEHSKQSLEDGGAEDLDRARMAEIAAEDRDKAMAAALE